MVLKKINLILSFILISFFCKSQNTTEVFYSINEALKKPLEVKHLDLSDRDFKTLPKEVFSFKNLEVLILNNCLIEKLPDEISQLNSLKVISASHTKLNYIPESFFDLINIEYINFFNCEFLEIPNKFHKLKRLKTLVLCENSIVELPSSIWRLRNLEFLCFDFYNNCNFSKTIFKLNKLERLELFNSGILSEEEKALLKNNLKKTSIIYQ
ncbi:MAG: leucine-rich repeat domain-containing protein [Luteibaculaceae bacterium]